MPTNRFRHGWRQSVLRIWRAIVCCHRIIPTTKYGERFQTSALSLVAVWRISHIDTLTCFLACRMLSHRYMNVDLRYVLRNVKDVHSLRGFGNLRTGELVICKLTVRTTDVNLGYNANQKMWTFYANKRRPYTCLCICNAEMTFITIQNAERNRLSLHVTKIPQTTRVRCGGNYLHYTGPTYMPNQRINMAQKESHSKILPSPTYMEITKNSIGLSRSKGLHVCRTLWLSALGYRVYLTLHNCSFL